MKRLFRAYADDWKGTTASGPEPARRAPPSPLNSPPFPNADWSYGGAPDIGVPDSNVPPLMAALYGGQAKAWEDSRVKIYGWFEGSLNLSTSHQSNSWYMYEKDMPNVAGPLALETGPGAHSVPPARCAALPLSGLP